MAIVANNGYNNPALGQAFQNIASMFAPPTVQEQAAAASLQQTQASVALAQQQAAAKVAAIDRIRATNPDAANLFGAGDSDPIAHTLAQQQAAAKNEALGRIRAGTPTLSDFYAVGDNDGYSKMAQGKQLELANKGESPAAQDRFAYARSGKASDTFGYQQSQPLSEGQTRVLPPDNAEALGVPQNQVGTIKQGDRTYVSPGGRLPSLVGSPLPATGGAPAEESDDEKIARGLAPGVAVAGNGMVTFDAPDKKDTVDSVIAGVLKGDPELARRAAAAKAQGGGQNININTGNPQKVDDAVVGADAEEVKGVVSKGYAAPEALTQLGYMREAVKRAGPNLVTGPLAQYALKGKQALGALLGTEIAGTSEAEVINNLGFTLATQAARAISTRPTQFEFGQALAVKPGLALSPVGLDAVLNIKEQEARDNIALAQLARDPANLKNWAGTKQAYFASHPIMSPFDPSKPLGAADIERLNAAASTQPAPNQPSGPPTGASAPVKVQTPEEAAKLPSGTQFVTPDGRIKVRP